MVWSINVFAVIYETIYYGIEIYEIALLQRVCDVSFTVTKY